MGGCCLESDVEARPMFVLFGTFSPPPLYFSPKPTRHSFATRQVHSLLSPQSPVSANHALLSRSSSAHRARSVPERSSQSSTPKHDSCSRPEHGATDGAPGRSRATNNQHQLALAANTPDIRGGCRRRYAGYFQLSEIVLERGEQHAVCIADVAAGPRDPGRRDLLCPADPVD